MGPDAARAIVLVALLVAVVLVVVLALLWLAAWGTWVALRAGWRNWQAMRAADQQPSAGPDPVDAHAADWAALNTPTHRYPCITSAADQTAVIDLSAWRWN